ncbi:MAG: DNA repair protein RecN [Bacteroidales bacterium]|nr:DNA repair protein RecN [Bacteroidales bacterium]
MLKSLYISNYALISELQIDFEKGFSVITGETGAGKSIIIGALSLILGQRAESKTIKTDAEKCVIEAEFDISGYKYLGEFFSNNDLDFSGDSCLIRRELINTGKSRAFINDTPVSLNVLRDLTIRLIDIHSQHDNLLLSNENYQLEVVDTIAKNSELLASYSVIYNDWQNLSAELKKLEQTSARYTSELDFIQFQFKQLTEAGLIENEQEELETEQESLLHSEEIKSELMNAQVLLEEEKAVLPLLKDLIGSVSRIKNYIPGGENWIERLQSSYIELKDIQSEISSFADRVEFNPSRLEWIESRLSELYTLQKKYKVSSVDELVTIRDEYEKQLQKIESFDEDIENLKLKIADTFENVKSVAAQLTESRKKAATPIENYMVEQLTKLGMPNIQFKVDINNLPEFLANGNDEIQFLFSANKNRTVQPVQLIASGGEVSRLMLSIKSLIADKSDLPTIIFDEIDIGVSGEIAHRMGEIMQSMSVGMQVIAITHLPQIAAKSAHHYRVYKDDSGLQTQTHIEKLTPDERVTELAQMLSGKKMSEASVLNARELLGMS